MLVLGWPNEVLSLEFSMVFEGYKLKSHTSFVNVALQSPQGGILGIDSNIGLQKTGFGNPFV